MGRMEELFYELYASSKRHDSWQRQAMIVELRALMKQPIRGSIGSDHFERYGDDRRFGGGQFREGADDDDERDLLWKKENPEDPSLNDKQLVETEVATEPIETKHGIVKPEANANVILANLEEEPIPQIQVPISKLERGLKIHNVSPAVCEDSQYVVGCDELCEHQGSILQVSHVKEGDVLVTDSASVTINQVAHQLFDKMSFRVQSKRRQIKHLKGWKFKFKRKSWVGIMLQIAQYKLWERRRRMYTKVSTNIKDESMKVMITWNHQRMLRQLHKSRVQCKMRIMNDSWSMRQPTLKIMKSHMKHKWKSKQLQIASNYWINHSHKLADLVLRTKVSELERKKKKLCYKTWMFKYKAPLKRVQFLHYYDKEVPIETNWAVQRIWNTECPEVDITADANTQIEYTREGRRGLVNIYDWCILSQLFILIGSGSTHNFMDPKITEKLGCLVESAGLTRVSVADGNKLGVKGKVDGFKWNFQSTPFEANVMLIPLGDCDMVLGVQWLETLGPITWNFKKLEMSFMIGKQKILLHGMKPGSVREVKAQKLNKLLDKGGVVAYKLDLPDTSQIHPVFHDSQLKVLVGNVPTSTQLPTLLPDIVTKKPEFMLECKMVKRKDQAVTKVLIKWANEPVEGATWEFFLTCSRDSQHLNFEDKILKRREIVVMRSNQKRAPKYFGPYKIIDRCGEVAYKLQLPAYSQIHSVFHVSQLKLLVGNVTTTTHLPTVLQDVFEKAPERILERKMVKRQGKAVTKMLIKWPNEPEEEATGEFLFDLLKQYPQFDAYNLEDKVL